MRATRRARLQDLSRIINSSLAEMARECKTKCKSMLAESPWLQRQFLAANESGTPTERMECDQEWLGAKTYPITDNGGDSRL